MVADGRTIDYTYDSGNRLWQVLSPASVATITYGYDTGNRLSQITAPLGLFNISYDLAGRRTGLSYPNGVTTTYSYNRASFLTSLLAQ
jgi:YD repeat-containing protein